MLSISCVFQGSVFVCAAMLYQIIATSFINILTHRNVHQVLTTDQISHVTNRNVTTTIIMVLGFASITDQLPLFYKGELVTLVTCRT